MYLYINFEFQSNFNIRNTAITTAYAQYVAFVDGCLDKGLVHLFNIEGKITNYADYLQVIHI